MHNWTNLVLIRISELPQNQGNGDLVDDSYDLSHVHDKCDSLDGETKSTKSGGSKFTHGLCCKHLTFCLSRLLTPIHPDMSTKVQTEKSEEVATDARVR